MKYWLIGATAASVLALLGVSAQAGAPAFYQEQGDAGGSFDSPQAISGGPFSGIIGDIGGCVGSSCGSGTGTDDVDKDDFYLFGWLGGSMNVDLRVDCTGLPDDPDCVSARLFSLNGDLLGSQLAGDLDGMDFSDLPAGNYILQVHARFDPPFSVDLRGIGPDDDFIEGLVTAPSLVPEPASMAILGLGLAGLGLSLRRRRTA